MAVGRLTNYGRQWMASISLTGAKPGASSDNETGLTVNGSAVPSFWVVLIGSAYNFTALNNGPDPDHSTIAALGAPVISPTSNYSGHDVPRNRTRITTTKDDTTNTAAVAFIAGQEPYLLITAVAGLTNIGGWALCTGTTSSDNVIGIFPAESVITSIAVNNRLKILDTALTVATS